MDIYCVSLRTPFYAHVKFRTAVAAELTAIAGSQARPPTANDPAENSVSGVPDALQRTESSFLPEVHVACCHIFAETNGQEAEAARIFRWGRRRAARGRRRGRAAGGAQLRLFESQLHGCTVLCGVDGAPQRISCRKLQALSSLVQHPRA